jgi:hypothetical protein
MSINLHVYGSKRLNFNSDIGTLELSGYSTYRQIYYYYYIIIILLLLLFILTASGFVPGGSGTTIRHNTQNNTP